MKKSERFEPIQDIASSSANELSRAMAEAGRRVHSKNLDAARAEYEKRRLQWSEKRIETESLGRAVERFRKEERGAADRREQPEGDDAAVRIALTARGESGNH